MVKNGQGKDFMWAYLIHLGYNISRESRTSTVLRCDKSLWDDLVVHMAEVGVNKVVIDLNEGVKYESHPEIGVEGAWSVDTLKAEIKKIRDLGMDPIPKLNFSTCHDAWMGKYSRYISTKLYYDVVANLINEVMDIFDNPEFFHLGMDEENYSNQRFHDYAVIRQGSLWWHDFLYMVKLVEDKGGKAWIWGDMARGAGMDFVEKMPKSVLISDWHYRYNGFDMEGAFATRLDSFRFLSKHGFLQAPAGSNYSPGGSTNLEALTRFGLEELSEESFMGMFQTVWYTTQEENRYRHFDALEGVRRSVELRDNYLMGGK